MTGIHIFPKLGFSSAANAGLRFRAKEELPYEYTHTWQEWTHHFIDRTLLYGNERFVASLPFHHQFR